MKITRKQFLLLAGSSLAGAAAVKGLSALDEPKVVPEKNHKRWAMAVDFQKCRWDEGCKGCINACKRAHNIPDIPDEKHAVKWIWKQPYQEVFPQQAEWNTTLVSHPLMLLCNHCDTPACTRVCPTQATWKREDGVVMMDWHRCIGCRYCMAACPYGSRSFNFVDPRPYVTEPTPDFPTRTKGVVEKCNFCEERLAKGEKPACVEGCGSGALLFGDLADPASEIRRVLRSRYAIQRQTELGTGPAIYYLI